MGNAIGLLGRADVSCGARAVGPTAPGGATSSGNGRVVSAPITACGNGVGLLGRADASCGSGSDDVVAVTPSDPADPSAPVAPIYPSADRPATSTTPVAAGAGPSSRSPQPGRAFTVKTFGDPVPVTRSGRSLAYTGAGSGRLMATALGLLLAGLLFAGAGRRRNGTV